MSETEQTPKSTKPAPFEVIRLERHDGINGRGFWVIELLTRDGVRVGLETRHGSWLAFDAKLDGSPLSQIVGTVGDGRWEPQKFGIDPVDLQKHVRREDDDDTQTISRSRR